MTKLKSLKDSDSNFIADYIRTGDEAQAAMNAYNLSYEAAVVKASIMLRDKAVLDIVNREMRKDIPDTAEKAWQEVWALYKKCKLEGNKIKSLELFMKLKGFLSETVVNNNYQSWNVLIQNAARQKELQEPLVIDITPGDK